MFKAINIVNLIIVSILAGILGQYIGPRNFLPNPVLINEHYFDIMRMHFLFLGAFSCLVLFAVGKLLKASYMIIVIALFLAAIINYVLMQSSEPEFLDYFFEGLLEFLLPFLVGGMGMLAFITMSQLIWIRIKSNENT